MSYAGTRLINDADSHLMELPDFLTAHAEPDIRDELVPMLDALTGIFDATAYAGRRGHSPSRRAELAALGENLTRGPKWHDALGAFSGDERSQALNLLGFQRQVIFSSFCARPIFTAPTAQLRYGAARAHNR
ncbi:MAG: hydrolase, partial [Gammaproteobacteria bacterium]|nr:hydrolase [Gammaproteobacteria bacterium]